MKFLIVDDDPISQQIIKKCLADYGTCDIMNNGKDAIKAFRTAMENEEPYDLVTMDIMMPGIDGQQALQEIRKIDKEFNEGGYKKTKVIMMSALGNPKNLIDSFYKGSAAAYIVKPIEKEILLQEMRKIGINV